VPDNLAVDRVASVVARMRCCWGHIKIMRHPYSWLRIVFRNGYDAVVDWSAVIGGVVGGVIGVASGVSVTLLSNRNARWLSVDARHARAYEDVLAAAQTVDTAIRNWKDSSKDGAAAKRFDAAVSVDVIRRARVAATFGSLEVQSLYEAVWNRVRVTGTRDFDATTPDDYKAIADAVRAFGKVRT
jgi:hypothetical protein